MKPFDSVKHDHLLFEVLEQCGTSLDLLKAIHIYSNMYVNLQIGHESVKTPSTKILFYFVYI